MGLFGNKKEGGLMDVIRCDEPEYLVWKWRPAGANGEETKRENSIRFGSSLRVKDGEVAVFAYKQKDGTSQDFIEGPYDDTIKTANFPILSSIVGLGFGGSSPFQAEVYYINTAGIIQIKFGVPYFDVFDPRFLDFAVPVAVRGAISFKIADYKEFVKLHRLVAFNLDDFKSQVKAAICKYVKGVVSNAPAESGLPVMQLERKILQINELVENYIKPRFQNEFGVLVSSVDIEAIEVDKDSDGYNSLKSVTQDIAARTTTAQADINIKNMQDTQAINAENMSESLRIQREEMQRAQKLQTESQNLAAFQVEKQAEVGIAGAQALGQMGSNGGMNMGGNGSFNPAGMMAGMAMGGAIGQNITNTMGGMMNGINQPIGGQMGGQMGGAPQTPPPVTPSAYNVVLNGQSAGPYDINGLGTLVSTGQLTKESLVWKQGMANWVAAGTVQELSSLFASATPPTPPVPPVPGV